MGVDKHQKSDIINQKEGKKLTIKGLAIRLLQYYTLMVGTKPEKRNIIPYGSRAPKIG